MPISEHFKHLRSKIGNTLLQIPGVAAVIHDETGKVLLQQRTEDNSWSLSAGAIEPGETPAQALIREVWEETSLKVKPLKILGVFSGENGFRYTYPNGDRVEYLVVLFQCRVIEGEMQGRDGETANLQYFAPDNMPELAMAYPHSLFDPQQAINTYFEWDDKWLKSLVC
ncbi:MAG: NUDIX domain-containing protein [Pleurocapsa sp.]